MVAEFDRKVPVNVSLDIDLLRRIDAFRGAQSRSEFLREVVAKYLDAREPETKGQRKLTDKTGA